MTTFWGGGGAGGRGSNRMVANTRFYNSRQIRGAKRCSGKNPIEICTQTDRFPDNIWPPEEYCRNMWQFFEFWAAPLALWCLWREFSFQQDSNARVFGRADIETEKRPCATKRQRTRNMDHTAETHGRDPNERDQHTGETTLTKCAHNGGIDGELGATEQRQNNHFVAGCGEGDGGGRVGAVWRVRVALHARTRCPHASVWTDFGWWCGCRSPRIRGSSVVDAFEMERVCRPKQQCNCRKAGWPCHNQRLLNDLDLHLLREVVAGDWMLSSMGCPKKRRNQKRKKKISPSFPPSCLSAKKKNTKKFTYNPPPSPKKQQQPLLLPFREELYPHLFLPLHFFLEKPLLLSSSLPKTRDNRRQKSNPKKTPSKNNPPWKTTERNNPLSKNKTTKKNWNHEKKKTKIALFPNNSPSSQTSQKKQSKETNEKHTTTKKTTKTTNKKKSTQTPTQTLTNPTQTPPKPHQKPHPRTTPKKNTPNKPHRNKHTHTPQNPSNTYQTHTKSPEQPPWHPAKSKQKHKQKTSKTKTSTHQHQTAPSGTQHQPTPSNQPTPTNPNQPKHTYTHSNRHTHFSFTRSGRTINPHRYSCANAQQLLPDATTQTSRNSTKTSVVVEMGPSLPNLHLISKRERDPKRRCAATRQHCATTLLEFWCGKGTGSCCGQLAQDQRPPTLSPTPLLDSPLEKLRRLWSTCKTGELTHWRRTDTHNRLTRAHKLQTWKNQNEKIQHAQIEKKTSDLKNLKDWKSYTERKVAHFRVSELCSIWNACSNCREERRLCWPCVWGRHASDALDGIVWRTCSSTLTWRRGLFLRLQFCSTFRPPSTWTSRPSGADAGSHPRCGATEFGSLGHVAGQKHEKTTSTSTSTSTWLVQWCGPHCHEPTSWMAHCQITFQGNPNATTQPNAMLPPKPLLVVSGSVGWLCDCWLVVWLVGWWVGKCVCFGCFVFLLVLFCCVLLSFISFFGEIVCDARKNFKTRNNKTKANVKLNLPKKTKKNPKRNQKNHNQQHRTRKRRPTKTKQPNKQTEEKKQPFHLPLPSPKQKPTAKKQKQPTKNTETQTTKNTKKKKNHNNRKQKQPKTKHTHTQPLSPLSCLLLTPEKTNPKENETTKKNKKKHEQKKNKQPKKQQPEKNEKPSLPPSLSLPKKNDHEYKQPTSLSPLTPSTLSQEKNEKNTCFFQFS